MADVLPGSEGDVGISERAIPHEFHATIDGKLYFVTAGVTHESD